MNYGELILSKMIESNTSDLFKNYQIKRHHFQTSGEREAYDFINDYIEKNRQCPDYRTLVANIKHDFTFMPDVSDSFEFLATELKNYSAKVQTAHLIENQLGEKFSELDGIAFIDWLNKETEKIQEDAVIKKGIGNDLTTLKTKFKEEYLERKSGKSSTLWTTPFKSLTSAISGFTAGDIYGIMAESGRGKSFLSILVIHHLLKQGANVLVKSFELKAYLWLSRLFSIISAEEEMIESKQYRRRVGLENRKILTGQLEGTQEEQFFEMVDKINGYYPGRLFLQCKGDEDLTRSLDDLDRELRQHPEINVVFLDPFYGLTDLYTGRNANKVAGGAAEEAANRFEQLCGIHNVVGFYTIQATIEKSKKDKETGERELKLPTRDQLKTSKRLIDIATILFSWDSVQGLARLGVEKGRNGAEGLEIELISLMDVGVIQEPPTSAEMTQQFLDTIPF